MRPIMRVTSVVVAASALVACTDEAVDAGLPVDFEVNVYVAEGIHAWVDGVELPMSSTIRESFADEAALRRFRLNVHFETPDREVGWIAD
jgi:hypothetical protein